jgi:GAF domain-containing protein
LILGRGILWRAILERLLPPDRWGGFDEKVLNLSRLKIGIDIENARLSEESARVSQNYQNYQN